MKKTVREYLSAIGKKGGKVKSAAKREAARERALRQWAKRGAK